MTPREQFERWYNDDYDTELITGKDDVEAAWEIWQAARTITPEMIEEGAQRLVNWSGDDLSWPNSWSALDVAAARNDAERVLLSALGGHG